MHPMDCEKNVCINMELNLFFFHLIAFVIVLSDFFGLFFSFYILQI